jgi:uncharacterized sulfatase
VKRQAVLFLIDTQGANCVGVYAGLPGLGTPHVDRLAGEGLLFEKAYTCSPVCGPARSAIFTGLYPHSNGVLANDLAPHADIPHLGRRLTDGGRRAAYIGKWHLDGTDYFGDGRCPEGWDAAYWFDGRNYLNSLPDAAARDLSRQVLGPEEVRQHGITAEFTHAHRVADRAIDFIRRYREEGFLLVVSIDEPHHPYICPEPFVSAFETFELPIGPAAHDTLENKPRGQREWAEYGRPRRAAQVRERDGAAFLHDPRYFSCNSFSDHEVGRVLAEIDAQTPGALVIYTADHGDMGFAHGLSGKGPVMYEQITRVPLIMRQPGVIPAGKRTARPASHVDLMPTLLAYFGLEIPPLLQGRSLFSPDDGHAEYQPVFIEFNRFEVDHDGFGAFFPIRAIFDGRYKLAINLLDTDELYDLQEDPGELRNLISEATSAGRRDKLHARLLAWMGETRDPLRGPHWVRRPWTGAEASPWGGPTRPRPFDEAYFPRTLLYETGREIERRVYDKG